MLLMEMQVKCSPDVQTGARDVPVEGGMMAAHKGCSFAPQSNLGCLEFSDVRSSPIWPHSSPRGGEMHPLVH